MRIIVLGVVGDENMFHIVDRFVKEDFGWAKSTIVSRCGSDQARLGTGSPPSRDIEKSFCVSVVHSRASRNPN